MQLQKKPEVARFLRFCTVGLSSFVCGFCVFNLSYVLTGKLVFSSTLAYALSVVNGFLWNRLWTFRERRAHPAWNQGIRFAIANGIGYCINLVTYAFFLATVSASVNGNYSLSRSLRIASAILHGHAEHYSFLLVNAAGIVATAVVILWNYLANCFWTFRK